MFFFLGRGVWVLFFFFGERRRERGRRVGCLRFSGSEEEGGGAVGVLEVFWCGGGWVGLGWVGLGVWCGVTWEWSGVMMKVVWWELYAVILQIQSFL